MRMRFATSVDFVVARIPLALAIVLLGLVQPVSAQNGQNAGQNGPRASTAPALSPGGKKILGIDDYSKWRAIEGSQISADGKYVAYALRFQNILRPDSKPELHIVSLDGGPEVIVPNASGATFSPDGRFVVYQIDTVRAQGRGQGGGGQGGAGGGANAGGQAGGAGGAAAAGGNAQAAGGAQPPRLELRELATGKLTSWTSMQNPVFSPASNFLLMRKRPAGGGAAAGGAAAGAGGGGGGGGAGGGRGGGAAGGGDATGTDAVLYDLNLGRSVFVGSVNESSFDRRGTMLAYSVASTSREGNGLFLIDLATLSTKTLENDTRIYSRITWNDNGTALAALKGKPVDQSRERDNLIVVYPSVRDAVTQPQARVVTLDPATAQGFQKGFVISERATLTWSEDGQRVFFSTIPQTATENNRTRSTDSVPNVDVWRTTDTYIQSQQMIQADGDRNFTFRQAMDVASGRYIALTDSTMRTIQISPDGLWAVGRDNRAYISDFKEDAADFYRVDTRTGQRTLMFKNYLTGGAPGITPDGKLFIYWKDAKYQAYDLAAGTSRTIGTSAPSFINVDDDHPGTRPPFGFAGYTADGKSAIARTKYDLWVVPLDGSAATNLTKGVGTQRQIRFTPVRVEPLDSTAGHRAWTGQEWDLSKPITLQAFGELTKKDGFFRLANGQLEEITFEDAAFSVPQRAQKADRWLFTRQTFQEFPDLRVTSNAQFGSSKKISDANPQHSEYAWGRRILVEYKDADGHKLQGMLAIPESYKQGDKLPMIVNFYEKNSQNFNRYSAPSYITGMGAAPIEALSRGYLVLIPDIYYHTGSSHSDQLESVEAATREVIRMGYVDPKRIGLNGHSYGGEGAQYIATRSRLFAAVGAGAGVTDLFTDFSQNWGWAYAIQGGSGANGNEYYMTGQGRWGFSPWEKPEVYYNESALYHVPETTAAVLLMHGTADPTVSFNESLKFYNALRFNGKNAILLAYQGEGHGLTGLANRRDLTIRYFQFFDHYLRDAPAPKWMTDGVPFLQKPAAIEAGPGL